MSTRLQVVIDDEELAEIREVAARQGMTVSAWVRGVLRDARRDQATGDVQARLAALDRSAQHAFPTGDVDQMLAEIATGKTA